MGLIRNNLNGSITSNKGVMGPHTPFVTITRKSSYNPSTQNKLEGYPINSTHKLSALSGFTRVKEIHLRGIPATEGEIAELEAILKSGVTI